EGDGVTRWYSNDSTAGSFTYKSTPNVLSYTRHGSIVDLDGDGNADWVVGGGQGRGNDIAIWINYGDGKGNLRKPKQTLPLPANEKDTAVPITLDMDGDGDIDLVAQWNANQQFTRVYRNDGTANGTVTLTPVTTEVGLYEQNLGIIAALDYDQDGDVDLVGY